MIYNNILTKISQQMVEKNQFYNDYRDNTLTSGIPSKLILLSEMEKNYSSYDYSIKCDEYIKRLINSLESYGIANFSMYTGTSGIGMSICSVSKNGEYLSLSQSINELLISQLDDFFSKIDINDLKIIDYDLISGISGVIPYLIIWKDNIVLREYLYKCLNFLIDAVLGEKIVDGKERMNLFITSENQMTREEGILVPKGAINTSLSHGIAGVGVVLSICYLNGIIVEDHEKAIEKIKDIYLRYMKQDDDKIYWSNNLTPEILDENIGDKNDFIRDAWCYGVPGISLFFLYAGEALKSRDIKDFAVCLIKNSFEDVRFIYSPILCHGYAGLLEISKIFYKHTNDDYFKESSNKFKNKVLSYFDYSHKYGFKNYEYVSGELVESDEFTFLDGALGICLSLLSEKDILKKTDLWKEILLLY